MFTSPEKNLKAFEVRETDILADLGAGTGFYTIILAKLASSGKVYAIDLHQDFLATIRNKAKEARLGNIECVWGNVEKKGGTKIAEHTLDKVVCSNMLFQVEDRDGLINEIKRILKPKGRLLLIDWSIDSPLLHGKHAVKKNTARDIFEAKGFVLEREIDAGIHHYGMIFVLNK